MSKDVIIAGAIAAGCVALVAVALLAPKSKPEGGEPAKTSEPAFTSMPPGLDPAPVGGFSFGSATGAGSGFAAAPGTGAFPELPPASTTLPPAGTGFGPQTSLNPAPVLPGSGFTPVEPVPSAAAASAASEHTVAAGELLGDISLKHYGSSKHWKRIVDANPGMDPHTLKVGQKIKIPPAPAAAGNGAAAGAALTAAPGERTYTIKASDSLYGIAQRELGRGSRWKEIQSLNPGLNSNDLKVGKVIKLPGAAAGAATTASPAASDGAATSGKTHTVAKGETLADISKKHFGTSKRWKDIVAANPGVSPEGLKVGQKLAIPGGSAEAAAPAAGASAGSGDYTVKAGDTIRSIAATQLGNGNEWKKIQEANPGLNPRALRPGQKIRIPGKAPAPAPAATPAPAAIPAAVPLAGGAAPAPFSPAPFDASPAVPDFANPYAPAPADAGGFAPLGTPAGPQR